LNLYFADMKTLDNKQVVEIERQKIATQLILEVELLKQFDPDKELKEAFETASLHDLQKYLDDEKLS
jgi:hypothetical protein